MALKNFRYMTSIKGHESNLIWFMRFGDSPEMEWSWRERGIPNLLQLTPIRMPRSSASNRHIPVSAHSVTNGAVLHLESGLEHDLVRRLDRDSTIVRMVSQPLRLSWSTPQPTSHTPDLLTIHEDGAVTVWDVRALEEQDDDFRSKRAITRDACEVVGWRYEVFTGLGVTERLNLLWLHGFRRRPPWADQFESEILRAASIANATLGTSFSGDDGAGGIRSTVWHLIWTGALVVDITVPWNLDTPVTVRGGAR